VEYKVVQDLSGFRVIPSEPKIPWTVYTGAAGMPGQTAFCAWREYSAAKKVSRLDLTIDASLTWMVGRRRLRFWRGWSCRQLRDPAREAGRPQGYCFCWLGREGRLYQAMWRGHRLQLQERL
jgi:hypothetical protein